MTRPLVLAILTFAMLSFLNVAVFAFLYFRDLSQTMVTEQLVAGVNEAQSALNQSRSDQFRGTVDDRQLSKIAPRLTGYTHFHAVVVMDGQGNVIYREQIGDQVKDQPRQEQRARFLPVRLDPDLNLGPQRQVALEYDPNALDTEVHALRKELYRKLGWALGVSALLLVLGFAYVIWAYKRGKVLQLAARKADQMAYVGTLASGLAHEIRNPLNSMNMNIQLLQEELQDRSIPDPGDVNEMFDSTRREIQRLEKLVSSFLSYARPTQVQFVTTNLNRLITELVEFLGSEIKTRKIRLQLDLDEKLPDLELDEGQVRQALLNVIQNAIQVLEPGGGLKIETRFAAGDRLLVIIEDKGPGITARELEQIFKVFYSTRRGGTGLGLPIAQRIAELHGGGIKVESNVGVGTRVTLIFPQRLQEEQS